ncbi:unnamed protein product [Urochloa decumbens]|uniref:Annexin n=1 Tax=Urochloa decumbens TaxID=240449 RepID=A0ABC9BFY9_9POAL
MASLTVPPVPTCPRQDAIDLHRAFKGFGCDSTTVIGILAHRDAPQRALIQREYRAAFSQDLARRVASELSGHHRRAMLLWILDPASRDATLHAVRQAYAARFGRHVEHDVAERASGDHRRLLLAYLAVPRAEGGAGHGGWEWVDTSLAALDARELYKAGERRLGTDERAFVRVFSERSWAHLAAVARAYHRMYDRPLERAVKGETSGSFGFGLLTILRCAADTPARYFAKVLHKAMKGVGTSDTALIRVVVTRAEVDMQYIKAEYHRLYKRSLADAIHAETSGNYRTFLLSLVGRDRAY